MSLTPGLGLPFGIQPVNPVPVDSWKGPYASVLEANTSIPSGVRYQSMEVHIIISSVSKKYWYKNGILDTDLVEFKSGDTSALSTLIDVSLSTLSTNDILTYNGTSWTNTAIPVANSSQAGYLSSTDWNTFNNKQNALSGTGFVKISGTTISYDNSTYLPSSSFVAAGSNHQVQYNNSGSFAGSSRFTYDGNGTINLSSNIYLDDIDAAGQNFIYFRDFNANIRGLLKRENNDIRLQSNSGSLLFYNGIFNPTMTLNSSGNVSIGSSNSSGKLDITGSGSTSSTYSLWLRNSSNVNTFSVSDNGNVYALGTLPAYGSNTQIQYNNSGVLAGDSGLVYDSRNKKITLTSSSSMSIGIVAENGIGFSMVNSYNGTYGIMITNSSSNTSAAGQILFKTDSSYSAQIFSGSSVNGYGNNLFMIRQILSGSMRFVSSSDKDFYFGTQLDGTLPYFSINNSSTIRIYGRGIGITSSTYTAQFHNSTGTNNALLIRDDGNIGIGIVPSGSMLTVAGQLRLQPTGSATSIIFFYNATNSTTGGALQLLNPTDDDFRLVVGTIGMANIYIGNKTTGQDSSLYLANTSTNSKVGIGNALSTLNEVLHLNGRMYINDSIAPGTTTNRLYSISGSLYWNGSVLSSGGGGGVSGTTNYHAKFTSSSVIGNSLIYDNGTNIGINTTSPASKFHISIAPTASANYGTLSIGGNAFDGVTAGYFGSNSATNANGTSLAINESSSYNGDFIRIQRGGTDRFKVDNAGNMTLGGSGVNLAVNSTGVIFTGIIAATGYMQLVATSNNFNTITLYGSSHTTPNIITFNNNNIESARLDASNNFGLGISSSISARLHVVGSGSTSSTYTAQFHNSTGTNNALLIRDDGNIGINVVPTQKLHVSGNILVSGTYYIGNTGQWFDLVSGAMRFRTSSSGFVVQPNGTQTFYVQSGVSVNYGMINVGTAPFDGTTSGFFVGNANGTVIAINEVTAYAGSLFDYQLAGVSKFRGLANGSGSVNITLSNGTFTMANGGLTVNGLVNMQNGAQLSGSYGTQSTVNLFIFSASSASTGTGMNTLTMSSLTFNPTSGSAFANGINVNYVINQTSTATGITRGLYLSPTLTSQYDYRDIETISAYRNTFNVNGTFRSVYLKPTFTASSGSPVTRAIDLSYSVTNTGTVSASVMTGIFVNATDTGGIVGTTHNLMDLQNNGNSRFVIRSNGDIIASAGVISITGTYTALANNDSSLLINKIITGRATAADEVYIVNNSSTIIAAANNQVLIGELIAPTFTNGAFTGITNVALEIRNGDFRIGTAGKGIVIKSGSNAKIGTSTLVGGTITVANTSITANSRIFLTVSAVGGTTGKLSTTKINGTSFTINSDSASDTSTIDWVIIESA